MSDAARKLRVLVIDDTIQQDGRKEAVLGTPDLDPIEVKGYRPSDTKIRFQISTWESHLAYCSARDDVESPDLLCIDCAFTRDINVPGGALKLDPRGLLYGAIQVARHRAMKRWIPFGFSVYSRDLASYAKDAYAVTCFGLISAMMDDLPEFDERRSIISKIEERMTEHPEVHAPSGAWEHALKSYRKHLVEVFDTIYHDQDVASFEAAETRLRRFVAGGPPPAEEMSVRWVSSFGSEDVLVRSLFADCRPDRAWDRKLVDERALPWFDDVNRANRLSTIVAPARDWFLTMRRDGYADLEVQHGLASRVRFLALNLLWAYQWAQSKKDSKSGVVTQLQATLKLDSALSSRAVKEGTGCNLSLKSYLSILEGLDVGEWPPPLPPAVRREVRDLLKLVKIPQAQWPPCFQGSP